MSADGKKNWKNSDTLEIDWSTKKQNIFPVLQFYNCVIKRQFWKKNLN